MVNKALKIPHFRMETLRSVIAVVHEGEFLTSLDLTEAYLHIPILQDHQRYLRFKILGQHFQFQALSFGLATAPHTFTKTSSADVDSTSSAEDVESLETRVSRFSSTSPLARSDQDKRTQDVTESQAECPTTAFDRSSSLLLPHPFQGTQDQASPFHFFQKVSIPASQQYEIQPESQHSLFSELVSKTDRRGSNSSPTDSDQHFAYVPGTPELSQVGLCEENAVGSWPKLGQDPSQICCERNPRLSSHYLLSLGLSTLDSYSPERVPLLQELMEESSEPRTQKQPQAQASDTLLALLVVEDTSHGAQMGLFQHQDSLFCKENRSTSSYHQPSLSAATVLPRQIADPNSMQSPTQIHQESQTAEVRDLQGQGFGMASDNLLTQVMLKSGIPTLMEGVLVHSNSFVLKEDTMLHTRISPVQTLMDLQLPQKAEGRQQSSQGYVPFDPDLQWVVSLCNTEMSSGLSSITDQVLANAQPFIMLGRESQEDPVLASHRRTSRIQDALEFQKTMVPTSPGWSSLLSEGSSGGISMTPDSTETIHCPVVSDENQDKGALIPGSMKSSPTTPTSSSTILSDYSSMTSEENSDSVLSSCPSGLGKVIKELSCPTFKGGWVSQLSPWSPKADGDPSQISISPKHMLLLREEMASKLENTSSSVSSSTLSTVEDSADHYFTPPESPSLLQDCLQDNRALEDQGRTSQIAAGETFKLRADLALKGSCMRSERRDSSDDQSAGRLSPPETHHPRRDDWDQMILRHEDVGSSWSPSRKELDSEGSVSEQEAREDMEKVYKEIQQDLYVRATLFCKFLRSGRTLQKSNH
ncbi:uncharacterized protein LOC115098237 [Rhinatrema bivittatum]|uniref:uncharacterized protein LOC115098237 n=1 Tax=Rhinatrema bivittatum TaxID=194408 RepID=UPI0011268229|nr:uncharacterized protein LOC115098237 [Rhinatrema bivittatum]